MIEKQSETPSSNESEGSETVDSRPIRYVSLYKNFCKNNSVFQAQLSQHQVADSHPQIAFDDADSHWRELKLLLSGIGIELNTWDMNVGKAVALEIHADLQFSSNTVVKKICILIEPPVVLPNNLDRAQLLKYQGVITCFDELADLPNYIKLAPYFLDLYKENPVSSIVRKNAICFIGSKKLSYSYSDDELYTERIRHIRFLEATRHGVTFDLYGRGWETGYLYESFLFFPRFTYCVLERILRRLKILKKFAKPFACWRGELRGSKYRKLQEYDFSLCIENSKRSGYVSEKIFDAMSAGSIPIYLGAPNILEFVPESCFIDVRKFRSLEELYAEIMKMSDTEKEMIKRHIEHFLSQNSNRFSRMQFSKVVCSEVKKAIGDC